METRAHYVAVGAFVLAIVTLAFVAVLWLARAQLTTRATMSTSSPLTSSGATDGHSRHPERRLP